jgi:hypothetical protein
MKKLFVVLLALAVIGTLVSAEDAKLSVGAWGRMWMAPIASNGTDQIVQGAATSWDYTSGGRVGVSFNGSSDNIGFAWNPGVNGSNMTAVCDVAKIFAKISPMLTVQIGRAQGDVLRGKIGNFGDLLPMSDEDAIFTRFFPQAGLLLDITPIDGVYLGASIDAPSGGTALAKDAYKAIQIGAGYTITDIGMVRAQYVGPGGPKNADKDAYYQAAFAYTGMAGLTADAGVTLYGNSDYPILIAAGAKYSADALGVVARVGANVGGKSDTYVFSFKGSAQLSYTVADPLAVGVEAAFAGMSPVKPSLQKDARTVDVFPFVQLNYSNGYLKVGFDATVGLDGQDLQYKLPIQLQYSF